jgi:hypothetical protein
VSKHGKAEIDLDLRANTRKLVLWDKPLSSTIGLCVLRDPATRISTAQFWLFYGTGSEAVPMAMAVERIACRFADELRPVLQNI